MTPQSASPLGLTTSQAAHYLGVSLGTIRRWSDLGYLHSYRTPGGQRRFSREQIEEFVESLQRGERPRRHARPTQQSAQDEAFESRALAS